MKQLILLLLLLFIFLSRSFAQSSGKPNQKLQATFDSLNDIEVLNSMSGKMATLPAIDKRLLQLAEQIKADSNYVVVYGKFGRYFASTGNNALGLEYAVKSLEFAKKFAPRRLTFCYDQLGVMYSRLGNYSVALKEFRLGQKFLPPGAINAKISNSLEISGVYHNMRKPDSALKYIQQAYQYLLTYTPKTAMQKANFNQHKADIYRHFGAVYESFEEPGLVNYYYKRAIQFCNSVKMPVTQAYTAEDYSRYLVTHNEYVKGKNYAILSFKISRGIRDKAMASLAAHILYIYYDDEDARDSAFYYLKAKNLYQDSILDEERSGRLQSVIVSQQLHDAEEDVRSARDTELRKHNIQNLTIALILVLLVIIYLLLSRTIIVNTRVVEIVGVIGLLIVFEFINLILHPYLVRLTDDSPVLMLLILVLIAVIIVPLHHHLEYWVKNKLVEKNKSIRLAAAKRTIEELDAGD